MSSSFRADTPRAPRDPGRPDPATDGETAAPGSPAPPNSQILPNSQIPPNFSTLAPSPTPAKPLILVAGAGLRARRLIAAALGPTYRVAVARDGRAGFAAALREPPDLILATAPPPDDGPGLCERIKDSPGRLGRIPLVVMAAAAEIDRLAATGCRADEYLRTPLSAAELRTRVGALLRLREAERRLAEAEARLNLIMDNVPAGLVLLQPIPGDSPDFLITAVNRNVNKVAGFTQKFLHEGRRLTECLRPAAAHGMYGDCEIERRIAERMAWYASRPGETIWSVFPTVDDRFVKATRSPHGDFGFVVVTVDTSEQVRTERALARKSEQFDLMLENMPEGIFMCTPDFTVVACNHRVNTMLGVADGCVQVGRSLETSLRLAAEAGLFATETDDVEALVRWRMNWYTSRPEETVSIVYPAAGGRFLKFTRSPVGEPGMVVVFVDVTEQIRIEQDLKTARDRAEGTLEDLLATQNHLVQAEKMASLGRLVAAAAHEINTPLGVAVTLAALFSERADELAASLHAGRLRRSEMERYLAATREGCDLQLANLQRAADLVHSFKQVAADQTSDARRRFELGACLSDIVISIGPVWRKAGHRVDIACPEPIELDGYPGVISQILTNFVTNSILHGFEPGQTGVLTITARLPDPGTIELCYGDNGKGIAPEARDKVFQPFFTTRHGSGGTGLGLHIIHNLVTGKLGGSIEMHSEEGRGVRFVLRFPR